MVPPSQHPDQLLRILEALAQLHQVETVPVVTYLRQEAAGLPWGSTLVVISAQPDEKLLAALLDLKRVGRSVAFIVVGGQSTGLETGNIPVFYVSDDVAWELVKQIGLQDTPVKKLKDNDGQV